MQTKIFSKSVAFAFISVTSLLFFSCGDTNKSGDPSANLTFPVKYVLQGASPEKGRATLTNRAKELEYQ